MSDPTIKVDGSSLHLPVDDYQPQKVVDYNAVFAGIEAAWTSWTPTWTNLTVGNGVVVARYRQIGKLVVCRLSIVLGSTSSIGGDVRFTMPVTRAAYGGTSGIAQLGFLQAYDLSAVTAYQGGVVNYSTTEAQIRINTAGGTYVTLAALSSTVPFTWATGDEIHTTFIYEAA